jgi:hypothetical protein
MSSKTVKSLDTDELIEALNSEQTQESQHLDEELDSVLAFIHKYKLHAGDYSVKNTVLYSLYKSQCKETPTNLQTFSTELARHFHRYSNRTGVFYLIDRSSFAISEALLKSKTSKRTNKLTSITYQNHFQRFLDETDIKSGHVWTEGFIIFEAYRYYCIDRKLTLRFSYDYFIKFLKLHFNHRRVTQNRSLWFAISNNLTTYFTEEQKDEIRQKRKNPKKSNKKRKKRVPLSRPSS